MHVFLIEDDPTLSNLTAAALRAAGFAVDTAAGAGDADDLWAISRPDLVILDLGLPDRDGLAWLRAFRARESVPVLILTARGDVSDRVAGLDAGADDYLVKPFEMPELLARCRAMLRRPSAALGTSLDLGPLSFDTATREASLAGRSLPLGPRERTLLEVLLRRAGRVVTREAIEDALYGLDEAVTPNAVEATVSRLRRHLRASDAVAIVTVRGVGYMLRADAGT